MQAAVIVVSSLTTRSSGAAERSARDRMIAPSIAATASVAVARACSGVTP